MPPHGCEALENALRLYLEDLSWHPTDETLGLKRLYVQISVCLKEVLKCTLAHSECKKRVWLGIEFGGRHVPKSETQLSRGWFCVSLSGRNVGATCVPRSPRGGLSRCQIRPLWGSVGRQLAAARSVRTRNGLLCSFSSSGCGKSSARKLSTAPSSLCIALQRTLFQMIPQT